MRARTSFGYQRQDVEFEKLLFEMQRGGTAKELEQITPVIVTDSETGRADGNNVSAEQEASLVTENRIRYELYATILRSQHLEPGHHPRPLIMNVKDTSQGRPLNAVDAHRYFLAHRRA